MPTASVARQRVSFVSFMKFFLFSLQPVMFLKRFGVWLRGTHPAGEPVPTFNRCSAPAKGNQKSRLCFGRSGANQSHRVKARCGARRQECCFAPAAKMQEVQGK